MGEDKDADDAGDSVGTRQPPNANLSGDGRGADEPSNRDEPASEPAKQPDPLPSDVEKIMAQYPRVAKLFAGTATGTGPDGQLLKPKETAPESYDYAFIVALVRYQLRDVDVLATALKRRGVHVAAKGDDYVADVIVRALASADPIGGGGGGRSDGHSFTVDDVTVFDGDPPVFTLTIKLDGAEGVPITFETAQLLAPAQFMGRCFEKLRKFVAIPDDWRETVERWMASARIVTPPAEGTHQGSIVRAARRAVGRLSLGESLADIRDGRGVLAYQRGTPIVLFEIDAVMAALKSHDSKPVIEEVTQALYKIGAKYGRRTVTFAGKSHKTPRCWAIKAPKELLGAAVPVVPGVGGNVIPFTRPKQDPPPSAAARVEVDADNEDVIV